MNRLAALGFLSLSLSLLYVRPARAQDAQPTPPVDPAPVRTGTVVGQLANGTAGGGVPGNLAVMLHAWDAAGETLMLDGQVDPAGAFRFDEVDMEADWTFAAMLTYNGVTFFSEPAPVLPDQNEISLPLTVYETTTDTSAVRVSQLHTFLEYVGGEVTVVEVYVLSNTGDRVVAGGVTLPDGRVATLEFAVPGGANKVSFEANEAKSRFGMLDAGRFADTAPLLPGEGTAQVVVEYGLPYQTGMALAHPILYPVDGLNVIQRAEAGVTITGPGLAAPATQTMGDGGRYAVYTSGALAMPAGLSLTLSGRPNEAVPEAAAGSDAAPAPGWSAEVERLALPIAGGVLGLALIGGGAWWLRRTTRLDAEPELTNGGEVSTEPAPDDEWSHIVHAMAELDAAHERGEVADQDHAEARASLKARARDLLAAEQANQPLEAA
jgi:hypothetical protein